MTHYGPYYKDGTPLKIGDRVALFGWTDSFEIRSFRPEDVAIIANVTPGFEPMGTSTVPIAALRFIRRADGSA